MNGDTCHCGHVLDEHEDTTMQPCSVDGCYCIAYEATDD